MRRVRKSGFTLTELLVVVAILVILAGTILPKLDLMQLRANKGVAASNMHGVSSYIQNFRAIHNVYPDRWDSLMDSSGTALWKEPTPGAGQGLEPQTNGSLGFDPVKLKTATLTDDGYVRSLNRMGITRVQQFGSGFDIPGNAYSPAFGSAAVSFSATTTLATINDSDDDGKAMINQIFKIDTGVVPAGSKLVVFGFGPGNECIGDVLQETPFYSNTDATKYYHRFLAIFEAHESGRRAELKMVVGADGDRIQEEIGDFYGNP